MFLAELWNVAVEGVVKIGAIFHRAGNNEGGAGFVNEDGIDLIDDGKVMPALHHLFEMIFHVVAKIIEPEFVVGAVGHIASVLRATLIVRQTVDDAAYGQTQELIDTPHPFGVTLGKIVVYRDDMHAFASESVEVNGKGCHQGLTFAGLHFGYAAFMKHHAADELDVEMALSQRALGGFAHGGEGRSQQIIERDAFRELRPELDGSGAKLGIGQLFNLGLQCVDRRNAAVVLLYFSVVGCAEYLSCDRT
jgi:hypothetical protein